MFKFLESWKRKRETELIIKENIESLIKRFKDNPIYPDYPNILFFYQYFFEKLFKNYIYPNYLENYAQKKPVILEIGSYKSRILELLPPELKERYVLSDINLEALKENLEGIRLNFDFRNIPIKENSLPIIIGSNVFLHILGLGNIEEILRILKDGGEAIFVEDLNMYVPALALYYQKKGNKYVYFVYDPNESKIKCFILEKEKINDFFKEIENLIKTSINFEKAHKEFEQNFSEDAVNLFNDLKEAIKNKFYLNDPFKFSIILFALVNQINSEFLVMDEKAKQNAYSIKLGLNNFLLLFKNVLEKYKNKEIKTWTDFIEDLRNDLEKENIFLEYDFVTIESNYEEIQKWQNEILNNTNLELLAKNNPYWEVFKEYKNLIIEKLGLDIGCDGEAISNLENNIRYKALIIKLKKEVDKSTIDF
jgi:SAM-dependent methyltransferase